MVIGRAMRNEIPPVAMSFWRWCIAALVVLPFVVRELRMRRQTIRRSWMLLTIMGVIGVSVFNTVSYAALRHTTATNGVLFNSTIPVLIILIGWIFLHEALSRRQALGVAVSLLGVLVIVARGDASALAALQLNAADLWLLSAMLLWAVYTIMLRWKPRELSDLGFLACIILFGLPWLSLGYAVEIASGARFELTSATAMTLAYYGVFPSVLAYLFFNRGVAALGPTRAGIFVHLVPVFGFILSALFLDEPPRAYHLVGVALVFAGIWLCSTAPATVPPAGTEL